MQLPARQSYAQTCSTRSVGQILLESLLENRSCTAAAALTFFALQRSKLRLLLLSRQARQLKHFEDLLRGSCKSCIEVSQIRPQPDYSRCIAVTLSLPALLRSPKAILDPRTKPVYRRVCESEVFTGVVVDLPVIAPLLETSGPPEDPGVGITSIDWQIRSVSFR